MSVKSTSDDAGATLIELIVYITLSTIIALAVATTLAALWGAQSKAATTGTATSQGDVMARGIDIAMRNAVAWDVSDDGTMLMVATNLGGARACQAWFVDSTGKLRQTSSATNISLAAAGTWPVRIDGVEQLSGASYFSAVDGESLSYAIGLSTTAQLVPIKGTIATRNSGGAPCW